LGIDSLTAAEFSLEIEERTGVHAPLDRFLGEHTLEDVAREMAGGAPTTETGPAEVASA
jgi:acyl carrier protein